MPKREDISSVLIIGSGPIVIGQACEFDYSGTQACKALKDEGYKVILVNSNPATIMTDPTLADRTYIEPIVSEVVEKIIEIEKPDVLLPTLGGQTALNVAVDLAEYGVLERNNVELIGAKLNAIKKAENRELFKDAMLKIGLDVPRSGVAHNMDEAWEISKEIGYPIIIRPSFTLGGTGGSIAYNVEEFAEQAKLGLEMSPVSEILVEQSVIGWKEFEYEVMRDCRDNVVIICAIENFDPMGVHTGDSITVAPAQTLTDKEYQRLRDASVLIIREIGVDTGGSNIQFAVNPENGELVVIEMNPRVSRSSALASKATGFPIAKIAAKLAIGYTLDEISNDITKYTPASFEPTIDYVVVKIPRFTFEKFPQADPTLTTMMKSVGEVMSIGRTFKESLHKAIRSLEIDSYGFEPRSSDPEVIREKVRIPGADRLWFIADAFRQGMNLEEVYSLSKIDRWFLYNVKQIIDFEKELKNSGPGDMDEDLLRDAKQLGYSDVRIADCIGSSEDEVRKARERFNIKPVYKMVDTCAAEFEAYTPYLYSTYESESEADPTDNKSVVIFGCGPNRIGQGIEFDYCCVHASFALKEEGYESIMVNCNPETVSTDYDTSDRLYFEPLTLEDTLEILNRENPEGVIVQLGGQTPLKLALPLERRGVKVVGTSPDSIDLAEDRERFREVVQKLQLRQPQNEIARSEKESVEIADKIGYPVIVRPSYVLGGRAMEVVYGVDALKKYIKEAVQVSQNHPVLIDEFLNGAKEVDVDAVSDGRSVVIGGILEHIEEAGIHSGDSAMVLPPFSIEDKILDEIRRQTKALALALKVKGLVNVQFAIKDDLVYLIEVNPRASRTIPFISKAIGVPLVNIGTKVMMGSHLEDLGFTKEIVPRHYSVKESVFPFVRFPGVDSILGPEMVSTGEVMGIDDDLNGAFSKSQMAAGNALPLSGSAFISVKDDDKSDLVLDISRKLHKMGFKLMCTKGTSAFLLSNSIENEKINKVAEGRPDVVDHLKNGDIQLVVNTTFGEKEVAQSLSIRRTALMYKVPYFTTVAAAKAGVGAIEVLKNRGFKVKAIQDYNKFS